MKTISQETQTISTTLYPSSVDISNFPPIHGDSTHTFKVIVQSVARQQ